MDTEFLSPELKLKLPHVVAHNGRIIFTVGSIHMYIEDTPQNRAIILQSWNVFMSQFGTDMWNAFGKHDGGDRK